MPRDLNDLLQDTAVEPSHRPDTDWLVTRGRRRRRVRHALTGLGSAAAVAAVVALLSAALTAPRPPTVVPDPAGDAASPSSTSATTSATPSPTASPSPSPAGPSTDALLVSRPELVELDPTTGSELRRVDARFGEGWVQLSVTPDGGAVFHEELWTGCATRLWRTPLDDDEPELVGKGLVPRVSPDGSTLAYVGYAPCFHDDHRLVLRDLASGDEQVWPLSQPDDELARITHLSWSPGGRRVAVEVGYAARRDASVEAPTRYAIHLVDTGEEPQPIDASPLVAPDDHTIAWRLPTFAGDAGSLLVVELCCDIGLGGGPPEDDAETFRLQEVQIDGEGLTTLVESTDPITFLASGSRGDRVLYVTNDVRDPRLWRLEGGESVPVDAADVRFAAWVE
jgi:hypothetical protein